jgi:galactokinase
VRGLEIQRPFTSVAPCVVVAALLSSLANIKCSAASSSPPNTFTLSLAFSQLNHPTTMSTDDEYNTANPLAPSNVRSIQSFPSPSNRARYTAVFNALRSSNASNDGQQVIQSVARAPGRVNIIGEHIDYSGFNVFPMGIDEDIIVGLSSSSSTDDSGASILLESYKSKTTTNSSSSERSRCELIISNTESKYQTVKITDLSRDGLLKCLETHAWFNYYLIGLIAALDYVVNEEVLLSSSPDATPPPPPPSTTTTTAEEMLNINVEISGSIPPASGLSSSSALIVSSTLSTLNYISLSSSSLSSSISRLKLAEICINAESLIGTLGGGMDQTASILSRPQSGLMIQFAPSLACESISLSKITANHSFVICQSLEIAEKAVNPNLYYNKRVVECRICGLMIGKLEGVDDDSGDSKGDGKWKNIRTLRQALIYVLQDDDDESSEEVKVDATSLKLMSEMIETLLSLCSSPDPDKASGSEFYLDDILRVLDIGCIAPNERKQGINPQGLHPLVTMVDEFGADENHLDANGVVFPVYDKQPLIEYSIEEGIEALLSTFGDGDGSIDAARGVLNDNETFFCLERGLHVYREALRVLEVGGALKTSTDDDDLLNTLNLVTTRMNDSDDSCSTLYDCSSSTLKALTTACHKSGALSSRLTGAGWGGSTISLVPSDGVNQFVDGVTELFYKKHLGMNDVPKQAITTCGGGGGGACVLNNE